MVEEAQGPTDEEPAEVEEVAVADMPPSPLSVCIFRYFRQGREYHFQGRPRVQPLVFCIVH